MFVKSKSEGKISKSWNRQVLIKKSNEISLSMRSDTFVRGVIVK